MSAGQNPPLCTDERVLPQGTGVSVYAHSLAAAQRTLDPDSIVLRAAEGGGRWRRLARALRPTPLRAYKDLPRSFVGRDPFRTAQVTFDLRRRPMSITLPGPQGIMHWSYPMPLRARGWHNVYTIHDLIPLLHPGLTPIAQDRHRRLLGMIATSADLIVTVSEASRQEIVNHLGCAAERVVNCGVAVTPPERADPPPAGLLRHTYLLVLGSVEPRKNIRRIIDAHTRSGIDLPLVIAGPSGWRADTELADAGQKVVRLPWLPEAARSALLANASALLMPSLAEGFGLPVVEAMAAGVPVICSAAGALAETAGGAAWLIDTLDVDALAAGISRVALDKTLRERLIAAGYVNAGRFTPARFAGALADAYAPLIASAVSGGYSRRQSL